MTETEAITKWCPFARLPSTSVNRKPDGDPHPASGCLASGCMAWRWTNTGRYSATTQRLEDGEGGCGLAAKENL